MENFIPDILNENIIYEQFDYIKSADGTREQYHYYTDLSKLAVENTDLYFESRDKKVKEAQIEIFQRFCNTFLLEDLETFFELTYSSKEFKLKHKGKISGTYLEVISLPFDSNRFDLILVCTKTYRQLLTKKKTIILRFELLNNKIKSAERKINTTEPNNPINILEQILLTHKNDLITGWDYYYESFIEQYLDKLDKEEIEELLQKIFKWNDLNLSRMAIFLLTYHKLDYSYREYIYGRAFSLVSNKECLEHLIENLWLKEDLIINWEPELLIGIKQKASLFSDAPDGIIKRKAEELIRDIETEFRRRNPASGETNKNL